MTEVGAVGAVKRGVVREAAGGASVAGRLSALNHRAGGQEPFDSDVFPKRRAGGLLKDPADLRTTAVEGIRKTLQGQGIEKVLVDVSNQFPR